MKDGGQRLICELEFVQRKETNMPRVWTSATFANVLTVWRFICSFISLNLLPSIPISLSLSLSISVTPYFLNYMYILLVLFVYLFYCFSIFTRHLTWVVDRANDVNLRKTWVVFVRLKLTSNAYACIISSGETCGSVIFLRKSWLVQIREMKRVFVDLQ